MWYTFRLKKVHEAFKDNRRVAKTEMEYRVL